MTRGKVLCNSSRSSRPHVVAGTAATIRFLDQLPHLIQARISAGPLDVCTAGRALRRKIQVIVRIVAVVLDQVEILAGVDSAEIDFGILGIVAPGVDITISVIGGTKPDVQRIGVVDRALDPSIPTRDIDAPQLVGNILLAPHDHITVLRNLGVAINAERYAGVILWNDPVGFTTFITHSKLLPFVLFFAPRQVLF